MSYQAPTKEIQFVLKNLTDVHEIMRQDGFEESVELTEAILEEAAKLAEQALAPINHLGDRQGVHLRADGVQTPPEFKTAYADYVAGGWGAIQFPESYGGQGLPFVVSVAVQEMIHAANMALGLCPLLTQGAVEAILKNASTELKNLYLPKMVQGEWTGTMNLTEPQAGSDLSTLTTTAKPVGDHYVITGQKSFITWGDHDMAENVVHLVLARLPDAPVGSRGISLFLVPKFLVNPDGSLGARNDCHVISIEEKMGIHASPTCVMSYGDQGGAIGYLIGEENKGLACMFTMMNNARLTVGLQGVSVAERAYQLAKTYAAERIQGVAPGFTERGPIDRHPDVQRMLMLMRALTESARALAYWTCQGVDKVNVGGEFAHAHEERLALLTPIVKNWCTDIAQEVAYLGIQCHGGAGFIEEAGAAQLARDARILPIYEGTNGIQALDLVHRKVVRDGGKALFALTAEMHKELSSVSSEFEPWSAAIQQGIDAMNSQTQWLLEHAQNELLLGAVATDYAELLGCVISGYLLLLGMSKAYLNETDISKEKIEVAQYYILQVLPRHQRAVIGMSNALNSVGLLNLMRSE